MHSYNTSSSLSQDISYNISLGCQLYQHLPFYYCVFLFISCIGIPIFNLIHINIEALFILYNPLQLFWNHTDVFYRIGIMHNSLNKVGTLWIPFHNCFLLCHPGINLCIFYFNSFSVTHGDMPLIPFLITPWVSIFSHDFTLPWKGRLVCRYYTLRIDGVFPPNYQKGSSLYHEVATSF